MASIYKFFNKYAFVITAFVGWIITAYTLYFIKYKMYAGTVNTLLMYFIIFPPMIALSDFLSEPKEYKEKKNKKLEIILNAISYIILVFLIVMSLIKSPYNVAMYDLIVLFLFVLIISRFPNFQEKLKDKNNQKERLSFVLGIYIILIIVPLALSTVIGAKDVKSAEKIIEDYGYTDVAFIDVINNDISLKIVFEDKVNLEEETRSDLGYYLFKAKKENEFVGVAINVLGGEIVGETLIEGNSYINYYIK